MRLVMGGAHVHLRACGAISARRFGSECEAAAYHPVGGARMVGRVGGGRPGGPLAQGGSAQEVEECHGKHHILLEWPQQSLPSCSREARSWPSQKRNALRIRSLDAPRRRHAKARGRKQLAKVVTPSVIVKLGRITG